MPPYFIYGCGSPDNWPSSEMYRMNLDWMLATLKTMKEQMDKIESQFDNIWDTIDQAVQEATAGLQQQLNQQIEDLQNQVSNMISDVESKITNVETQITVLTAKHNQDIANLQSEIDKIQLNVPDYQNPESGDMEDLQTIINFLYFQTFSGYITAGEFDSLNLTAQQFDSHNFYASQFDRDAKQILMPGTVLSLENLQSQITAMNTSIETLNTNVTSINSNLKSLNKEVETLGNNKLQSADMASGNAGSISNTDDAGNE